MYGKYGHSYGDQFDDMVRGDQNAVVFQDDQGTRACITTGATGNDVYFLRVALYDGHGLGTSPHVMSPTNQEAFDSGLKTAVESFQRAQGLEIDGIAGPDTWRALGTTGAPCGSSRGGSRSGSSGSSTSLTTGIGSTYGPWYKQTWFYWTVGGIAVVGALALFMLPKKGKRK